MSDSKVIEVEFKIQYKKRQQLVWGVEPALLASPSDLGSGGTELFPRHIAQLPRLLADLKCRSFGIIKKKK